MCRRILDGSFCEGGRRLSASSQFFQLSPCRLRSNGRRDLNHGHHLLLPHAGSWCHFFGSCRGSSANLCQVCQDIEHSSLGHPEASTSFFGGSSWQFTCSQFLSRCFFLIYELSKPRPLPPLRNCLQRALGRHRRQTTVCRQLCADDCYS